MTRIKCRYVETGFDEEGTPYPNLRCFEKEYKRFEFTGKLQRVGYREIWAEPPENDPGCMYTYDCILYLEVDGEIIIDVRSEAEKIVRKWHSVEDVMPGVDVDVLLYASEDGEMQVGWLDEGGYLGSPHIAGKVTHWMPLPEPPKGKDK